MAAVKEVMPSALVSLGTLVGHEPLPIFGDDDPRFVWADRAYDETTADFFDIHSGPAGMTLEQVQEQHGYQGQEVKPLIMGEFPASRFAHPGEDLAAQAMVDWQVESCDFGYDGWLTWHWRGEGDEGGIWPAWSPRIAEALSPTLHPDPCEPVEVPITLLSHNKSATASATEPDDVFEDEFIPDRAFDSDVDTWWSAGEGPPQWIEVDLEVPASVARFQIPIGFLTPVGPARIKVWGRGPGTGGVDELLHEFVATIDVGDLLEHTLTTPKDGIRYVRFEVTEMQDWVILHDLAVLGPEP